MPFKVVKAIVRDYLENQDRDVLYGSRADAILAAVKNYRLLLIRELSEAETRDDATLDSLCANAALPDSISPRDFLMTLKVLAILEKR